MSAFPYRIAGIPCLIDVKYYEPVVPGRKFGPPEHCYEDEGGYAEYDVCDVRGRPAPWLESKMTNAERDRVLVEIERREGVCP